MAYLWNQFFIVVMGRFILNSLSYPNTALDEEGRKEKNVIWQKIVVFYPCQDVNRAFQ
jgi:hypothetical protein